MQITRTVAASTVATWALLAPAAYADLTAAQVWEDWRSSMQGLGYVVTADEASEGAQLAVSNINIGMKMADDAGSMNIALGTLTFEDQSDGTVELLLPAVLPLSLTVTPESDGQPATYDMSINQTGQTVLLRGAPEDLVYDYSADRMTVTLDRMTVGGESFGPDQARFNLTLDDLTSTTRVRVAQARTYDQQMQTGPMSVDIYMAPPEEETRIAIEGHSESLRLSGTSVIPMAVGTTDMQSMLEAGLASETSVDLGAGSSQVEITDPEGSSAFATSTDGSTLTAKIDPDGFTYGGTQTGVEVEGQIAGLPFPVALSMAESGFQLTTPILKSEDPQDFAMRFNLTDFTMSDMIWGIFDPQGQLPRDPATFSVDLTGKAKLLAGLLSPEAAGEMGVPSRLPAEIQALNIKNLRLDAIGAELTGQGNVTFDDTDAQTVPGMPRPVGEVNLSLTGGNALLDKLVAMGVLPQDQAMGARMMLGLFAVPAEGEDALKSRIEFTENGEILANGQRVR